MGLCFCNNAARLPFFVRLSLAQTPWQRHCKGLTKLRWGLLLWKTSENPRLHGRDNQQTYKQTLSAGALSSRNGQQTTPAVYMLCTSTLLYAQLFRDWFFVLEVMTREQSKLRVRARPKHRQKGVLVFTQGA